MWLSLLCSIRLGFYPYCFELSNLHTEYGIRGGIIFLQVTLVGLLLQLLALRVWVFQPVVIKVILTIANIAMVCVRRAWSFFVSTLITSCLDFEHWLLRSFSCFKIEYAFKLSRCMVTDAGYLFNFKNNSFTKRYIDIFFKTNSFSVCVIHNHKLINCRHHCLY